MKFNKASLALFGGITAGFFVLVIVYIFFGGGEFNKTDIAIIFSLSATLLASGTLLYEGQRKKQATQTCTKNTDAATYHVP